MSTVRFTTQKLLPRSTGIGPRLNQFSQLSELTVSGSAILHCTSLIAGENVKCKSLITTDLTLIGILETCSVWCRDLALVLHCGPTFSGDWSEPKPSPPLGNFVQIGAGNLSTDVTNDNPLGSFFLLASQQPSGQAGGIELQAGSGDITLGNQAVELCDPAGAFQGCIWICPSPYQMELEDFNPTLPDNQFGLIYENSYGMFAGPQPVPYANPIVASGPVVNITTGTPPSPTIRANVDLTFANGNPAVSQQPVGANTGTYTDLSTTSSAAGNGAILTVVINPVGNFFYAEVTSPGNGYASGDTLTVSSTLLAGATSDLIFTLGVDQIGDTITANGQHARIILGAPAASAGPTATGQVTLAPAGTGVSSTSTTVLIIPVNNNAINSDQSVVLCQYEPNSTPSPLLDGSQGLPVVWVTDIKQGSCTLSLVNTSSTSLSAGTDLGAISMHVINHQFA